MTHPSPAFRLAAYAAALLGLLAPAARAADPKAEEIIASAVAAAREWQSYSCKMRVKAESQGGGVESFGEMSYLKPGFLKMKFTMKAPGAGSVDILTVSDGAATWTETRVASGEAPLVVQTPSRAAPVAGPGGALASDANTPSAMLDQIRAMFDLRVDPAAPEEMIEGRPADVLVGEYRKGSLAEVARKNEKLAAPSDPANPAAPTPAPSPEDDAQRKAAEETMGTVRLAIGRADRFLYRIEIIPAPAAPAPGAAPPPPAASKVTTTFYDVIFNPQLAPADFAYVPPQGAQIITSE